MLDIFAYVKHNKLMNNSPDRFQEELIIANALIPSRRDRDEDGRPDPPYSAAGHICENCRQVVEGLSWVEGFEYWGCDDCHEEALREIARELAQDPEPVELVDQDTAQTLALLARAGCTRSEAALWMQVIEKKVA
jgi:hypothetical protein